MRPDSHDDHPDLGEALRRLETPPHREGFDRELRARLEDVERRPASQPARRRRWSASPARRAALAGALALVVAALVLVPSTDRQNPRIPGLGAPPAAAQILERARAAFANARALAGMLVVRERYSESDPLRETKLRFLLTDRGDVRITGAADRGDIYYDAARATEIELPPSIGGNGVVRRGVAPGRPDSGPSDRALSISLGAVTRALAQAGNASVRETTTDGRPTWTLRARVPINKLGFTGDRLDVIVDRETGFPLLVAERLGRVLVRSVRVRGLKLNPRVGRGDFRTKVPQSRPPFLGDDGFRTMTLERAIARAGGGRPGTLTLPAGFRQAETRFARDAQPTGNEGFNPPSRDVISTAYRRGLDRVVVSTRSTGAGVKAWSDPVGAGEGFRVAEEPVELRGGALAGKTARVVIDPRVVPHLWLVTPEIVLTIAGPLSRAELIAAAESLR